MGIDIDGSATMIARGDRIDEGGLAAARKVLNANLADGNLLGATERIIRAYLAAVSHADAAPVACDFCDGRGWVAGLGAETPCPRCSMSAAPATPPAAGSVTDDLWALCYLHDWDPPKEGQEHRWEPGKNVFPEVHAFYRTWQEAEAVRHDMSNKDKYWVVRARPENAARLATALAAAPAPPVMGEDALRMPTDPAWYMEKAKLEDGLEIGAGRRTATINPTDAEIAEMERLQFEALPKWAQDEITRLRAALASSVPVGASLSQPLSQEEAAPIPTNRRISEMTPVMRAYLVTVAGEAASHERLVLTPDAATACTSALEDVFAVERERWSDDDQPVENPFWVSGVHLVARNDAFNGSTGIITP